MAVTWKRIAYSDDIATHAALITGIHGLALGAKVHNSANISIPTNTWTLLTFDTEQYDTDTIHDLVTNPGRLTCKTAGKYLITARWEWAINATGIRYSYIYLNGTTVIDEVEPVVHLTRYTYVDLEAIYDLAVNDYVEAWAYQNSGAAININTRTYSPFFSMQRIG